jgi:hypothetical protein
MTRELVSNRFLSVFEKRVAKYVKRIQKSEDSPLFTGEKEDFIIFGCISPFLETLTLLRMYVYGDYEAKGMRWTGHVARIGEKAKRIGCWWQSQREGGH